MLYFTVKPLQGITVREKSTVSLTSGKVTLPFYKLVKLPFFSTSGHC